MEIIARVHNDFTTKFGLPRQSGMVETLVSRVIFEPEYRSPEALRGLDGFSHLWLIWEFSSSGWSPTVRPPRLGGNVRMGVFATRSPFRPNPIGLSCVRLERIAREAGHGDVLYVSGGDMMDGTPVYDIKPYVPHADCRPEASGGFSSAHTGYRVEVEFPPELMELVPPECRDALVGALSYDPRPAYHSEPERVYGFEYAGLDIRFTVKNGVLTVREVAPPRKQG